jgi:hypothetical protein
MVSCDVVENIGEIPCHGDVNGFLTICQDRTLVLPL